jgi:hypothetical protein
MGEVEGNFNFCMHCETVILQLRCKIIQHMFHDGMECVNVFIKKCADVE